MGRRVLNNNMDAKSLEFLRLVGRLKHLPRKGWVLRQVPFPESVASHMYRMAMCVFCLNSEVNTFKIMKMALVHDLSESIVGDITPHDGVSQEEKYAKELEAIVHISSLLPESWSREEVKALWDEYERGVTQEAQIVKDLDKFDMILQALEYEEQHSIDLTQFFAGLSVFRTETVRKWAEEVYRQRNLHQRGASKS
jgi:putative hydrolase of HD superfamily